MVSKRQSTKNQSIHPGSLSGETRKSMENGINNTENEIKDIEPVQQIAQIAEGKSDDVVNGSHGINTIISDSMYARMMAAKVKSRKNFGVIYREALEQYLKSMGV